MLALHLLRFASNRRKLEKPATVTAASAIQKMENSPGTERGRARVGYFPKGKASGQCAVVCGPHQRHHGDAAK